jgi:uncharacterized protein (DUF1330 family)
MMMSPLVQMHSIGEIEVIDSSAQPSYLLPSARQSRSTTVNTLRTLNGRVQHIEGAAAPKNVAIVEWDSMDDAVAFYKSKVWTDLLAPQRDKSQKTIRRYAVEVER